MRAIGTGRHPRASVCPPRRPRGSVDCNRPFGRARFGEERHAQPDGIAGRSRLLRDSWERAERAEIMPNKSVYMLYNVLSRSFCGLCVAERFCRMFRFWIFWEFQKLFYILCRIELVATRTEGNADRFSEVSEYIGRGSSTPKLDGARSVCRRAWNLNGEIN